MIDDTFWDRCAEAGAAIIPFRAYNGDAEIEENFVGIKFVCISGSNGDVDISSQEKFYIYSEDSAGDLDRVGDTPEEALKKWNGDK